MNGILEKFLSLYKILIDSPARREAFEKITKSDVYPLPCCGHRWCENENSLHRAVEIWPAFSTFVKHLMKLPKAKQPAKGEGKSFLVLKKAVDGPLIQAKMKFLELLSSKLNEFLRDFQTDQSMVPFLAETLETLIRSFKSVMLTADTQIILLKIDVTDKNLYKPGENTNTGTGAKLYVSPYKKSPKFKKAC